MAARWVGGTAGISGRSGIGSSWPLETP